MSSAKSFSLDESKICRMGKGKKITMRLSTLYVTHALFSDEKEAFFSKLQMRLQHTPVRKTSGQKSSTATIEATESEGLTYSYEQSDPQTFSELFKTDTWTKSHSDSKVIEMEMYSGTHPNESQIEAQTKSTTQTGTTQYETGTQPSTQYSTRASLTQNKLVSKTGIEIVNVLNCVL